MRFGETVVRLRGAASANPYSGEVDARDWTAPDRLSIAGVGYEPSGEEIVTVDGNVVRKRAQFYLPFAADVVESDRIERPNGDVYEVTAPRADWSSPLSGRRAGSIVQAERVL